MSVPTKYAPQAPIKHNKMFFSMPSPAEMQSLIDFCKVMASAPFYQKLGPGGVMAIFLTAKEYNLPFMACLNGGIHAVEGKATFSGILINAMILDAGHTVDQISLDDKGCKLRFTRGDRKNDKNYKPLEYEYTTEMASKAGYLTKANWKSSLRDMLYNRCITGGGRKHFPEVLMGILVDGELVGTDADGDIPVTSGMNQPTQLSKAIEPPPVASTAAIEHVPIEGYKEFVIKHQLINNSDGTASGKMEYVLETCKKANMVEIQVVNAAIKNEKLFEERFDLWHSKKYPKARSMDELAMELQQG